MIIFFVKLRLLKYLSKFRYYNDHIVITIQISHFHNITMYQKDFLLRMIEMIAEVIARILRLSNNDDKQKADLLLASAYQDFLKKDAAFFHHIPIDELCTELLEKHHYEKEHLQILAELFFAEAQVQKKIDNRQKALNLVKKASVIFDYLIDSALNYPTDLLLRKDQIESFVKKLHQE